MMFINAISHYYPPDKVTNSHFAGLLGLSEQEIYKKSGIMERRKLAVGENTNTLSERVIEELLKNSPFPVSEVDLIVGATYTPYDTVATLGHIIQRKYNISNARVVSISAACSSFVNAVEIAECYISSGKASKALVIVAEHNSIYNDENNEYSGFLWGDGAAALLISKEKISNDDLEILDVDTCGHAEVGKGCEAVRMRPLEDRIQMPDGKDVFINASKFMSQNTIRILKRNHFLLEHLTYVIPHQANVRIINKVADLLGAVNGKVLTNIKYLGNTGSASSAIALSENYSKFRQGNVIVVTVFGGGYSSGTILLRK